MMTLSQWWGNDKEGGHIGGMMVVLVMLRSDDGVNDGGVGGVGELMLMM